MISKALNAWSEYRTVINEIRSQYSSHESAPGYKLRNDILFRGQPDAEKPLLTTLERTTTKSMSVREYLRLATRVASEIESYTGQKWNVPTETEMNSYLAEKSDAFLLDLPAYDYLVYLRHHGFPSPLLDWSLSPYVAAYFAFADCVVDGGNKVAIYAYIEHPQGIKAGWESESWIHVMGPNVSTDKRHFVQKAMYTIATAYDPQKKEHNLAKHEDVFSREGRYERQDVLIKIQIPTHERLNALRELDDYNINHFTLFQTEDSLMKALAMREFTLRNETYEKQ